MSSDFGLMNSIGMVKNIGMFEVGVNVFLDDEMTMSLREVGG